MIARLTEAELLEVARQQTNQFAVAKYSDSFLRIAEAVQEAVLAANGLKS